MPTPQPDPVRDLLKELHQLCEIGQYEKAGSLNVCDVRKIIDRYPTQPAPAPQPQGEPLFLLHCGKIDSSGEQDEWETEANSQRAVDAFAAQHPGQTIGLYATPQQPAAAVELSDAEIDAIDWRRWLRQFARAVLTAAKEKQQ